MTTYGILGPLSVTADGQPIAITAGRDRIVLAMLLLHPTLTRALSQVYGPPAPDPTAPPAPVPE